jgi:hypothetical protein
MERIRVSREIATTRPIPKIGGADVVIFEFYDDEGRADESR